MKILTCLLVSALIPIETLALPAPPGEPCGAECQVAIDAFLAQFTDRDRVVEAGGNNPPYYNSTNVSKTYDGPACRAWVTLEMQLDLPDATGGGSGSAEFGPLGPGGGVKAIAGLNDTTPENPCANPNRNVTNVSVSAEMFFTACSDYFLQLTIAKDKCPDQIARTKVKRLSARVICSSAPPPVGGGCATCGDSSPIVSAVETLNSGPVARFSFGTADARTSEKRSAGRFTMMYNQPDTNLFSPRVLSYAKSSTNVETIYSTNAPTYIRQVKGLDGLADIVVVSTNQYEVRLYHPTNVLTKDASGLWQVTNSPLRTVTFQNANPGTTNSGELRVTIADGGASATNHFSWVATNAGWRLIRPLGLSQHTINTVSTNGGTLRSDTHEIADTNTAVVSLRELGKHTNFAWGKELIEWWVNPLTSERRTTYEYYTGTNELGYSQLKKLTFPSGDWAYFTYDSAGRHRELFRSFKNQAYTTDTNLCRYTWFDYELLAGSGDAGADTNAVRTKIEVLLGKEVSRSYWVYLADGKKEIQCTAPGAAWNDTNNLVTTTRYYTNGSFNGWMASVLYPDGTFTLYEYGTNATSRTNIVWHGQPGATYTNVIDGTKTVTVMGTAGQTLSISVYDISSGILTAQETYSNFDEWNRPGRVTHLDGTYEDTVYGCCGPDSVTDREGVTTAYGYDALKRKTSETRNSISQLYTYDASGRLTRTQRQGTNGTPIILNQTAYDQAGRIQYQTNALGGVTSYTYGTNASGQLTTTVTNADGGTRLELYYADGRLVKVTGTAVQPVRYDYGVETDGGVYRL